MINENRALGLARSFALSRYNHRAVIIILKLVVFKMAARFVDISESEIDQFKENAVPQKTKEATNHQCNFTKTISRRRRREYRRIVTSAEATNC